MTVSFPVEFLVELLSEAGTPNDPQNIEEPSVLKVSHGNWMVSFLQIGHKVILLTSM